MDPSGKKKLLAIGYVWPEPNSSAAGKHMTSLLRLFKENGWSVHFASPAARGEHQLDLSEEGIEEHAITLNCSSFDEFVSELAPDIVLFDRFMMEEQFSWRVAKASPHSLRVLDMEDFHSLRNARHQAVKKGLSIENAELITDLAKREVAAIFRSDLTLVISDAELDILKNSYQVPEELLLYCPFLLEKEDRKILPFEEREHFISIGNFRHAPNWDAVLQLKQEIWPYIRKSLPSAELHVYGAYPPPKATQLHKPEQGFMIKGWASDAAEVMSKARLCLAPLRFGAGLKGKLTQAMQCGTPSITTEIGSEGIQGDLPWPGVVSNECKNFAEQAVKLYQDRERWNLQQRLGVDVLEKRFDKVKIGEQVMQRIEQGLKSIEYNRKRNFVGSMLQHQSMKATQYMSQWIEAKNLNQGDE